MSEVPQDAWLTIVGIGEDGWAGLSEVARAALAEAEVVTGAARHLGLVPGLSAECRTWPVPFESGLDGLVALRGRRVVLLASGDPFWFGAGSVVTRGLDASEWIAHPGPSTFTLAASRLGWPIEATSCLGLHAAPLARLRPYLAPGQRAIVLLRDGAAVAGLAGYLVEQGFGASCLSVLEALGDPRERIRHVRAEACALAGIAHPVAVGIDCAGAGKVMARASGRDDAWFAHDGQISKRPIRALALSALAPRPGELLWDIGTGSGSIAIEWLLAHRDMRAIGFEADPERAARAMANAAALGADHLSIVEGAALEMLDGQACPDAVFVGGGLDEALLRRLRCLSEGTRIVAHAVTLETEALLAGAHAEIGGSLLRIELSQAAPLGSRRGWKAHYPLVQWSATL